MWKTRLVQQTTPPRGNDVHLSRDEVTFVINLDDWWVMSATRHLADKALKENNLDFRMSELYGPPKRTPPVWTTDLVATVDGYDVNLLRDGAIVVVFSLQEFAEL